jgi:phospholipase/carboxylesterase
MNNISIELRLPVRTGDRPETGPAIPHLQHTDTSPPETRNQLRDWARSTFDHTSCGTSGISVPTSEAYFLNTEAVADVELMPPAGSTEWIHLHADGSVHVRLSDADEKEVLAKDWGEPHPLRDRGVREILVYAPRNSEEVDIVKTVFAASYRYATTGA